MPVGFELLGVWTSVTVLVPTSIVSEGRVVVPTEPVPCDAVIEAFVALIEALVAIIAVFVPLIEVVIGLSEVDIGLITVPVVPIVVSCAKTARALKSAITK